MKALIYCLFLVLTLHVNAQRFSSEAWHKGFVVSTEQDTIRGLVKYNLETNIVLVSRNNVVQTLSSQKVFYVQFVDQLTENYRQFYSIPYNVKPNYKVPILFELLYEGPLSLLAREKIETEIVNNGLVASPYGGSFRQTVLRYDFFFLDKKGDMKYYTGRKQDLYLILVKNQSQVKNFVKKNKLDVTELRDLIRVTAFYNSI